jgi:predicted PhzF superfamily epimerase YddE/YHI9
MSTNFRTGFPKLRTALFQLDAFTNRRFAGNPAAVMPMDRFPGDTLLQAVAAENNLSEMAFLLGHGDEYQIRWFTPNTEVPLCGHATLASAAVVMERLEPGRRRVVFQSASGPLTVTRSSTGYVMNFPARPSRAVPAPPGLTEAPGIVPVPVAADDFNYLVQLESAPAKGIAEDPVTGAAHCALAPYWAERLNKRAFLAYQASRRGGEIACRCVDDRVELEGCVVFYLEGEVEI